MGIFDKSDQETKDDELDMRMYCSRCKRVTLHSQVLRDGRWMYRCKGCNNLDR